jgi:hypothetical protein
MIKIFFVIIYCSYKNNVNPRTCILAIIKNKLIDLNQKNLIFICIKLT